MSGNENNEQASNEAPAPKNRPFSSQPTGLVETTFAETIGLSMHNAISNQQSSQMTTSASITNACARLLQAPLPKVGTEKKSKDETIIVDEEVTEAELQKKRFNILNFLKKDKTAKSDKSDKSDKLDEVNGEVE